jgi:hypothetical protein
MSFRRRRRLLRAAALGLAVAAVGAPASFSQNPYIGEGYGGSMDGGSPINNEVHASDPAIQDPYIGEGYGGSMDGGSPVNYEVHASDPAIQGAITEQSLQGVSEGRQPSATGSLSDGFNWTDAGVGAASALGLVMLAAAAAIPLRRHRKSQLVG